MVRAGTWRQVMVLVVLPLAGLLGGCSTSSGAVMVSSTSPMATADRGGAATTTAVAAATSPSVDLPPTMTPTVPLSPAALVARVVAADGDLGKGSRVKLIQGGDQVAGQVTLDNCGYHFTSEAHRVARRQVIVYGADGQRIGANEVVAYDSADQAAKALTQFRASVTGCPKNAFVHSTVAGVPDLRYAGVLTTDPTLPVADNAVDTVTLTVKGSLKHQYGVLIFQRQGRVLDGVYLEAAAPLTASARAGLQKLAGFTGRRLADTVPTSA